MAASNPCVYCGRPAGTKKWHEGCRLAFLEDLLSQVQGCLKAGHDFPVGLETEIVSGEFKRKTK